MTVFIDTSALYTLLDRSDANLSAGRHNLSLVDCVSFEMMRTLGIKTAFTFDAHFKEQDFTILPQHQN